MGTKTDLDKALGYFQANAPPQAPQVTSLPRHVHRIRCRKAGCKAILGQRLELSGMRRNIIIIGGELHHLRYTQTSHFDNQVWCEPRNQTGG